MSQCNRLDTTKGTRDPKVIALALLSRSLGHFKAISHLLEIGLMVEARTLTRCIFENLFMQGGLAEQGDEFVRKMINDAAKSKQSRGSWVLVMYLAQTWPLFPTQLARTGKPRLPLRQSASKS